MVSWTDVLAAVSSAIAALVVICAFVVAWHQWRLARADREDRTRPFVVIDFDFPEDSHLIFILIRNIGATMARNVRFSFEPNLQSALDAHDGLTPVSEWTIFAQGIPSLAPGKEIRFLFDNWLERKDLPDRYDVTVTYERDLDRRYTDEQVLDLATYRNVLSVERKNIHHVHERLKEIGQTLKSFRASGGGLRVVTGGEAEIRRDAWRRRLDEIDTNETSDSSSN